MVNAACPGPAYCVAMGTKVNEAVRTTPTIASFLGHLDGWGEPFLVRRGSGAEWSDREMHLAVFERDPELYALASLSEPVAPGQRMRALFVVLERSRVGLA